MRIGHQFGLLVTTCVVGGLVVSNVLWNEAEHLQARNAVAQDSELHFEGEHKRFQSLTDHFVTTVEQVVKSGSKYLETVARGQADSIYESVRHQYAETLDQQSRDLFAAISAATDRTLEQLGAVVDFGRAERSDIDPRAIGTIHDELARMQQHLEELFEVRRSELDALLQQAHEAQIHFERLATTLSLLYFLLICAAWRWSVKSTIHPLLQLAKSAQRAAEGHEKLTVREQGPEEVRVLARSLQAFATWLQDAHDTLEEKVVSRTTELEVANKKLEKDLQVRQQLETELAHAQKLEAIGQLAAGIAHEINTPIQFVGDNMVFLQDGFGGLARYIEVVQARLADLEGGRSTAVALAELENLREESDLEFVLAETPAAIEQSIDGIQRVATIVRAMKTFSHESLSSMLATDLNESVESTALIARNEWKYVAELALELAPDLPSVTCDPGQVNQAVLNLIVNAAHAIDEAQANTGKKGTITLGTRCAGNEEIEIYVSDTGTGIPEHVRPNLFTPFYTTKDVGKGTGQGLAIVYNVVVKGHGGTVTFESEMGRGTTFVLRLPVQPTRKPIPAVTEAA